MNKKALRADVLLLLTALLWGFGFVAQRSGMRFVGPFSYNGIRFIVGAVSLLPLCFFRAVKGLEEHSRQGILADSLLAGTVLFFGVIIQQIGILFTTAGNAGFLTGLYVVLVPVIGVCMKRKTGAFTWIGAVITLVGIYFISGGGKLSTVNAGDLIIIISAFFWAAHVLVIDRLVQKNDPILLSIGQFVVCGVFCLLGAFTLEPNIRGFLSTTAPQLLAQSEFAWKTLPDLVSGLGRLSTADLIDMLIPILYGGLIAVGIAYTLQVVAQKDAPPAHTTIILCFEGSFAVLGGVLLLNEPLVAHSLIGFVFMLAGMLLSQWDAIHDNNKVIRQDTPFPE